jgi:hypothetical protein
MTNERCESAHCSICTLCYKSKKNRIHTTMFSTFNKQDIYSVVLMVIASSSKDWISWALFSYFLFLVFYEMETKLASETL